ncbi:MAG: arsenical pump-driving ATPase [Desulfurivibrionaceae bacterium]
MLFDSSENSLTRNLFFTGKGGVGKTSLSCALAVRLADSGKRVLLVSTDPASNLDDVLGAAVTHDPTMIAECENLSAVNIDPEESARCYRERVIGPFRGVLPEESLASIEEQLSGACTMEIAAFDEFVRLLGDQEIAARYDHIVFDTAPTGHTLRLLQLPAAWSHFLDENTTGVSCLGPLTGLKEQEAMYKAAVATLADEQQTTLYLVARPDGPSLTEAARTRGELVKLGIVNQQLLINGVFQGDTTDPMAVALRDRQQAALAARPEALRDLPGQEFPLRSWAPLGIARLRAFAAPDAGAEPDGIPAEHQGVGNLPPLVDELLAQLALKKSGLLMTMGKGGVGKTTIASYLAVELAQQGNRVHLATTDPAAHLDFSLADRVAGLTISRIDPEVETEKYRQAVMIQAGAGLDEEGRKLLAEDLRSPCTEEIAVFQAFAQLLEEAEKGFLVIDTAPTGHTLLLLDAAQSYHREVSRNLGQAPVEIGKLLPRLRDPEFTRIFIVTLPEATPVHEAASLQSDLERAGIKPAGWIINQSLSPLTISDPLLSARRASEYYFIEKVRNEFAPAVFLMPWRDDL